MKVEITPRVKRLKDDLMSCSPSLCGQRAELVTQSYRETETQPIQIRRAMALQKILAGMDIFISREALIVGNHASAPRRAPVFPEFGVGWLEEQLDSFPTRAQDKLEVSPETRARIMGVIPYWKNKTLKERLFSILPDDVVQARQAKLFTLDNHEEGGLGHVLPDYAALLRRGLRGIKDDIERNIAGTLRHDVSQVRQAIFWKAAAIACEAVIAWAGRFSRLAADLAAQEPEPARQAELRRISEVCARVPEHPAQSFHEALQAVWFIHLAIQIETNGTAVSPGRLDQTLYPYYAADVAKGGLSLESAQELLDCFWLKLNELIKLRSNEGSLVHAGFPMNQNLTIGGQDGSGEDAANELSYLFLNCHEHIHLSQPQFSLRVHQRSPRELLLRAAEVIGGGGGIPQLISDEVFIPSMLKQGVPLPTARNYAPIGCVEYGVVGAWIRGNGGYFNVPKVLELALNNGVDRLTGRRIGLETGDPRAFSSYQEVEEAFRKQLEYGLELLAVEDNLIDMVHEECMPHIAMSCLVPGCIETGRDVTSGGARYNWTTPLIVGVANAADSLTAIKTVVFEEPGCGMPELIEALDNDFSGWEALQRRLLAAPKYGNDQAEADASAKKVVDLVLDQLERYETPRGGTLAPAALFSLSVSLPFGWATGATPDGRNAKRPLADGISPTHGMDVRGPTAVLKSAAKLQHIRTSGTILNQKFHPNLLKSREDRGKFVDLALSYLLDLQGSHLQVNVVTADTLRQAQFAPEQYKGLVIRVTGYSAFFTELSREVQDDIIERTEQRRL